MRRKTGRGHKKVEITAGKLTPGRNTGGYKFVKTVEAVGKTVQATGMTTVEGNYGDEPCALLFFTDGTKVGFVMPPDED